MGFWLILVIASVRPSIVVVDKVDVVEVNTVYDGEGKETFTQLIFWEWDHLRQDHEVVAWRIQRDFDASRGRVMFHDHGALRRVDYQLRKRTHTKYDPEMNERKIMAVQERRELSGVNNAD